MKEFFVLPVSNDSYAAHRGDAHRECSRANSLSREKVEFYSKILLRKLRLETLLLKLLQSALPDRRRSESNFNLVRF